MEKDFATATFGASAPAVLDRAHNQLRATFGFSSLRPFQQQILEAILAGKDCLAVLPTGSGKSLCYTLPAAMAQTGIVLVVSPLIALMREQVAECNSLGIPAVLLDRFQDRDQKSGVWQALQSGSVRLLFVAPERLAMSGFRDQLRQLQVNLVAIDEAHCISQWGGHFRPDYRKIGANLAELKGVPRIGLTATATQEVIRDIQHKLALTDPEVILTSPQRSNLCIQLSKISGKKKKLQAVVEAATSASGAGIIYGITRKDTEACFQALARALPGEVVCYHGGRDPRDRHAAGRRFADGSARLIVATSAFGMGVHRDDVRFVFQAGMPASLEQYLQGNGRAGRDGLPAECHLFYSPQDYHIQKFMLDKGLPEPQDLTQVYTNVASILDFEARSLSFGEAYTALERQGCLKDSKNLSVCLNVLCREGLLRATGQGDEFYIHDALDGEVTVEFFQSYPRRRQRAFERLREMRQFCEWEGDKETFLQSYFDHGSS